MTKISEKGQAVIIANFKELVQYCQSFGVKYNPSVPELQTNNLQQYALDAENQLTATHTANANYKDSVAQRSVLYKELDKLATRLRNAIQIYDILPQVQEQVITFTKKLQGVSKRKKANTTDALDANTPTSTEPKTISTAQTSFEQRLNTLDKIIQTLSNQPNYQPNEIELQVNTLANMVQTIRNANTNATNTEIDKQANTTNLNNLLYENNTSLKKVAAKIKLYIKSVFGTQSIEYIRVRKISV